MPASPWNKYIVNINGIPGQLNEYRNAPKGGILLIASPATLFPNRKAARNAIKRTLEFSAGRGFGWQASDYDIRRLQEDLVCVSKQDY